MTRDAERALKLHERLAAAWAGDGGVRVPYPIRIRELEVLRTAQLSPSLKRVTLGGPELDGFESHVPEEHVRLIFPDEHGELRLPEPDGDMLSWPRPMPVSREYTVRRYDAAAGELDVDFVIHAGGVASDWAVGVTKGECVHVAGPPGGFVIPDRYNRYLLAGDHTALPQIARYLETLPPDTRGWAFLDVPDEIELTAPSGFEIRWMHDGLEQAVRKVTPGERTFVWIAAEAGVVRPLRHWVRHELGIDPKNVRLTGYWKRGVADFDDD